jgi:MFS family permease
MTHFMVSSINKGLTPEHAGMILISQPVVMAVFSPLAGRVSDKIEPRVVASIGMGFTALGLSLFTLGTRISVLSYRD